MIPQMIPSFDGAEADLLDQYMRSGGFLTEFKKTSEFESLLQDFTSSKNAIVVNNGTVSLMMMMMALEIGPGNEVIVPNYTMIATPNSVVAVGATPVFVDVEESTLCMNLNDVIKKINSSTKAILFVAANGRYPTYKISELKKICDDKGIYFLEDAAQALGSFYPSGEHIGTLGIMGSLSFSVPKIISTGQGGCILTNDDDLAERLRRLKDFGRSQGGIDVHDSIGYNFKFTDLQACVGIAQMGKLNSRIARKKEIWEFYSSGLSHIRQVKIFSHNKETTAPWFIDAVVENRDGLAEYLKSFSIGTRPMYPPINSQKAYLKKGSFPISENIGQNGLWLPSYVQITDNEISEVCKRISEFYEY